MKESLKKKINTPEQKFGSRQTEKERVKVEKETFPQFFDVTKINTKVCRDCRGVDKTECVNESDVFNHLEWLNGLFYPGWPTSIKIN